MKSGALAIIGAAVGAVSGHALKAPFPGTGDNPALDLIAHHDPCLWAALRLWHYAWPAVAVVLSGSLCLSVWRVWLQPLFRFRRRGTLPAWPTSPTDATPSLVIGELHHPTDSRESEEPSWLVIPEKGLYTGTLIVGAVGTGKDQRVHVSVPGKEDPGDAGRLLRGQRARCRALRPRHRRRTAETRLQTLEAPQCKNLARLPGGLNGTVAADWTLWLGCVVGARVRNGNLRQGLMGPYRSQC